MAKEWYLLDGRQMSGFEKEALDDYGQSGFLDYLDSGMCDDVELYNYDLSVKKDIKVMMVNNTPNTKLKSMSREMLAPIGTCTAGMYIRYKNRYWIIEGLVDDNKVYEKAILSLCNHLLTWRNPAGQIIQRWANIESASQYNNGETSNANFFVRSDQLMVVVPDDEECLLLERAQRFIIDRRCEIYERNFPADVSVDTSKPVSTYKLTRADSVLYSYEDSGHYMFMASQDEQQEGDGYYVIDGKGYWLCMDTATDNDTEDEPTTTLLTGTIECDAPVIYDGLEPTIFSAKFVDEDGNDAQISPHWSIGCDFAAELIVEEVENSVLISTDNPKLVGKTFVLGLSGYGYDTAYLTVTIESFL